MSDEHGLREWDHWRPTLSLSSVWQMTCFCGWRTAVVETREAAEQRLARHVADPSVVEGIIT